MTGEEWNEDQRKMGRKVVCDGLAISLKGTTADHVHWRPGEYHKRHHDESWRWAQKIMTRQQATQ